MTQTLIAIILMPFAALAVIVKATFDAISNQGLVKFL